MTALVVVNYRSSALAIEAIRTARAASSTPLHVVVVDNSCDEREAGALRPYADVLLAAASNLGYAAAINLGRRHCEGDVMIVTNPDVTFAPHAIDALVAQLNARTAVAGPALFWDDAHTWMLPPGDRNTGWQKLDEMLASRSQAWARERDRRRFRERLRFWSLAEPTPVATLSGAVMAIRIADFDEAGGFDERFRLYFEETDFLRRMTKRTVYVPAARCRHIYNQSAASAAGELFAESERKYLEKWNGPWAAGVIRKLARPSRPFPEIENRTYRIDDVIYEASPLADFATAAGHFPHEAEVEVPEDVWDALKDPVLHLRVVAKRSGEVLAKYTRYRT